MMCSYYMPAAQRKRVDEDPSRGDFRKAMLNLLIAADFVRGEMDAICSHAGLTASQYNVLRVLHSNYPEGYPRSEIIQRMTERAPDVTRLVDRLATAGLVVRQRSDRDRRLSLTCITEKGIRILDMVQPELEALELRMAQSVSREDYLQLSRICELIHHRKRNK